MVVATILEAEAVRLLLLNMPFVTVDDSTNLIIPANSAMIPVMIPRTADTGITGVNSNWLIAGASALAILLSKTKGAKGTAAKKIKIGK